MVIDFDTKITMAGVDDDDMLVHRNVWTLTSPCYIRFVRRSTTYSVVSVNGVEYRFGTNSQMYVDVSTYRTSTASMTIQVRFTDDTYTTCTDYENITVTMGIFDPKYINVPDILYLPVRSSMNYFIAIPQWTAFSSQVRCELQDVATGNNTAINTGVSHAVTCSGYKGGALEWYQTTGGRRYNEHRCVLMPKHSGYQVTFYIGTQVANQMTETGSVGYTLFSFMFDDMYWDGEVVRTDISGNIFFPSYTSFDTKHTMVLKARGVTRDTARYFKSCYNYAKRAIVNYVRDNHNAHGTPTIVLANWPTLSVSDCDMDLNSEYTDITIKLR